MGIDTFPYQLRKFIRKIENNMSKNTAGVISVSAVFDEGVGRLCELFVEPSGSSAFLSKKNKQLRAYLPFAF